MYVQIKIHKQVTACVVYTQSKLVVYFDERSHR